MRDPVDIARCVAESVDEARQMAHGTDHSPLLNLAEFVREFLDADIEHITSPSLSTLERVVNARVVLRRAIAPEPWRPNTDGKAAP